MLQRTQHPELEQHTDSSEEEELLVMNAITKTGQSVLIMPRVYKGYEIIGGTNAVQLCRNVILDSQDIPESRPIALCEAGLTLQDLLTRGINNQFLIPGKVILIIDVDDLAKGSDPVTWVQNYKTLVDHIMVECGVKGFITFEVVPLFDSLKIFLVRTLSEVNRAIWSYRAQDSAKCHVFKTCKNFIKVKHFKYTTTEENWKNTFAYSDIEIISSRYARVSHQGRDTIWSQEGVIS